MAESMCARCGVRKFELSVLEPAGTIRKISCLQCANCGAVISVVDRLDLGQEIGKLEEDVKRIAAHLGIIEFRASS